MMLRFAAFLLAFTALGFGIPAIIGMRSLAAGNGVPLIFGYPSYGEGPFERLGVPSSVPLLGGFLAVCALELVAAVLVWQERRIGGILALTLLLPGIIYWIGFALPIPPIVALARTAILVANWSELT